MTENKLFRRRPLAVAVLAALSFSSASQANVNFTGTTYTQNFDTLANSLTNISWTNNSTLIGWHLFRQPAPGTAITAYDAGTGSATAGSFYSFGTTVERALGGLGSGGTYFGSPSSGVIAGWIAFSATNNSGATINSINVGFDGEQWRNGGNTTAQPMVLEYGFGATFGAVSSWTSPGGNFDWTSPVATSTAAPVNGNAAGLVSGRGGTLNSLNWTNGSTLWIRWVERNDAGNDHGLAIDNFSLAANVTSAPTVNLSVSANTGSEAGQTVITVTATASVAVTGNQTVNLAVTGTGITAGDYTMSNNVITIPNGGTTGSVTFTVVDDTAVEGTETATLTISNPSAGISLGTTTSQNITIIDNDNCGEPATKISAVQGNTASTPMAGQTVTIEGIVVGDFQGTSANSLQGFFVQEEDADADSNPATSEGIFVFDGTGGTNVNVGDKVRVVGTAGEFNAITQLSGLTSVQVCGAGQTIPSITPVDLPVPGVPNGDLATATTAVNNYFEPFESMLVRFPDQLKVSEYFQLDRFGQIVLRQGGRVPTFTSTHNPSVNGNINHQITLMRRQIVLDDGNDTSNYYSTNNLPLPYPTGGLSTSNRFRGGDTIANLSGVLQLRFGAWRIRPVEELFDYLFTPANPRKPNPPTVGGNLKVAAFNLLNYFTTIDTTASSTSGPCGPNGLQDCRGADSVAELIRQTDKAATALCGMDADIIGLMELENNATASSQALVDAANARCGAGLSFIHTGAIGGDAIKVGLFYKPARVSPTGTTAILDSLAFVNGGDGSERNRPALAQSFTAGGQTFTVIVNHLKSKGSPCDAPDAGDGQGNCNQVRTNAANALLAWLATNPTGLSVPDPDYLIVGDLNSYAQEDPIKALEAAGYTNLVKKFSGNKAYSFVFDGQTGYLDYALSSASLTPQVTGTREWHINADEPPMFDYNDDVLDTGEASFEKKSSARPLYEANPYRSSDHDPVIVGLQLGGVVNTINGNSGRNTLTGTAGRDRITGFAGADTLTGNGGDDEFVYTSLVDGIDTIMDFAVGSDRIDLSALLSAIGYQGGNPLSDGIVQFATAGGNAVVHIDSDGTAGPAGRRMMIIVRGVSAAALNNPANFIF